MAVVRKVVGEYAGDGDGGGGGLSCARMLYACMHVQTRPSPA